jgi:hypothetical protein
LDIFVTRPMTALLLLASFVAVAWPIVPWIRSRRREAEPRISQGPAPSD